MRINDTKYGLYSYQTQQNRSNINNETKKSTASSSSASSDVKISSRGREISQAMMTEKASRQMRLDELKQQIADGTYQVDSHKVAQKLTGFWKNSY